MDGFVAGQFFEAWENEGMAVGVEVDEVLYDDHSEHQELLVFRSKTFGNVLLIDEIPQCTERDEFSYHEMMAHLPLFCHPDPKKVLIVGGGDGGAIREINKHTTVKEIHQCELDKDVIEISKTYLPTTAVGYSSPKLTVHLEDGVTFIDRYTEEFDVIITDCTDYDTESSKQLYEQPYYEKVKKALKPDGVVCALAECMFTDFEFMKTFTQTLRSVFPVVRYAYGVLVPSYLGGQCGFLLTSKNKDKVLEEPARQLTEEEVKQMGLRYYNSKTHKASFALPQYVKEALEMPPLA